MTNIIRQEFFTRESKAVAKDLIGKLLIKEFPNGKFVSGMISKTDAYSDKNAVPNGKNQGAFYAPGIVHMYPTQGRFMLAIATLAKDVYNEILIRELVPYDGINILMKNRNCNDDAKLLNGPGQHQLRHIRQH